MDSHCWYPSGLYSDKSLKNIKDSQTNVGKMFLIEHSLPWSGPFPTRIMNSRQETSKTHTQPTLSAAGRFHCKNKLHFGTDISGQQRTLSIWHRSWSRIMSLTSSKSSRCFIYYLCDLGPPHCDPGICLFSLNGLTWFEHWDQGPRMYQFNNFCLFPF